MRVRVLLGFMVIFFLLGVTTTSAETIYVPDDYEKIQWAVDNAGAGDTIIVRDGVYNENVNITKQLTLKSENSSVNCIVDAGGSGSAIILSADGITVEGFTTTNSSFSWHCSGIEVNSNNNFIKGNFITNNRRGIDLCGYSNNNFIKGNFITNNSYEGIDLSDSNNNNSIISNNITNNYDGIYLKYSSNNNFIKGNFITNNSGSGIDISYSSNNNSIISNNITNNYDGIYLKYSSNNSIKGNRITNNYDGIYFWSSNNNNSIISNCVTKNSNYGIYLYESGYNNVSNNEADNNAQGIYLGGYGYNSIVNNNLNHNRQYGIYLYDTKYNLIEDNRINNGDYLGVYLFNSWGNRLKNNSMSGNRYNFDVNGSHWNNLQFNNNVDTSNLVEGKPIYYLVGASDILIDSSKNAGVVYCVNCNNITVKDLVLSNNNKGVNFFTTSNSKILNNHLSNNCYGIYLKDSGNNIISNNTATGNNRGVASYSSNYNSILRNQLINNQCGVTLNSSSNYNSLLGNSLRNNNIGMLIGSSSNNNIYSNDLIDNNISAYSYSSSNIWNTTNQVIYSYNGSFFTNYTGNYWSDYTGLDFNSDGIGDSPYYISSAKDNYPLLESFNYYFEDIPTSPPIYVPDNYSKIQWAVENATVGDKIIVRDGIYYENVIIDKILKIRSENGSANCIVHAENPDDSVFDISANYVEMSGFTVKGANGTSWSSGGISIGANFCNISYNKVTNNSRGIYMSFSEYNTLSNNIVISNNGSGIEIGHWSYNNTLKNNLAINNSYGIYMWGNHYGLFRNNTMTDNDYNFGIGFYHGELSEYLHDIDTSNIVDGKPICYLIGVSDLVIDSSINAGYIGIVNSTNVTVRDFELSKNGQGVLFAITSDSHIENVSVLNNSVGIVLQYSDNNTLTNNYACNNSIGIYLDSNNITIIDNIVSNNINSGIYLSHSNNNIIADNDVINNNLGIYLYASSYNNISRNSVSNNDYGIYLQNKDYYPYDPSSTNIIYLNNFIDNTDNTYSESINIWNSTEKTTYQYKGSQYANYLGNYWDDYIGSDNNLDGIGDTPYSVDSDTDNYPLMQPFENYFISDVPKIESIYITYPHYPTHFSENLSFKVGDIIGLHAELSGECDVAGEIRKGGVTYASFNLFDDGHSSHEDERRNDAIYSNMLVIPELPEGEYSFYITTDGAQGNLDFNVTGYPDGVLNVNFSVIDETPDYTYKNEELILVANVTSDGEPFNNATVNTTITLPNLTLRKLELNHIGEGTYKTTYTPDRGGIYLFETSAYAFLTEILDYIGGFDSNRIKVMKGNLSISSSSLDRYKIGEDVPLEVTVTSDVGDLEDEVNVIAEVEKEGIIESVLLTGKNGSYRANYTAEESGEYDVTYNATSLFYKKASCKNNFTITPELVKLNDTVKSFSAHSIDKIDGLQGMMLDTAHETEYFKEKVTETKLDTIADIVFDSAGALLSHLGTDQVAREYLLKHASIETIVKSYSLTALKQLPEGYTGDALKNTVTGIINTFGKMSYTSPEEGYYKAAKDIFDFHRNKIEEERDTTTNNLPPLTSEEEKVLIEDLKYRDKGIDYFVVKEAISYGLYYEEVYKEDLSQEEGWLPDLGETLFWTGAYVGAGFLSDGPCIGWVLVAQLAYDMQKDLKELDKYQKLHMTGTELFWKYPENSDLIYTNTVIGLLKVRDGVIEERPKGEINDVRQLSLGGKDLLGNWVEDEGYFKVKIENTGSSNAAYRVYAYYSGDYGLPQFVSYEMDEDEKAGVMLEPGDSRWMKVYWKNEYADMRPELGEVINFVLIAYTPAEYRGIYYNDYEHAAFEPEQVSSNSGGSDVCVASEDKSNNIISRPLDVLVIGGENPEVNIIVRNPYPMPITANVTGNSTLNWNIMLSPHESITLNYSLYGSGWIEVPPVKMEVSSPSTNQSTTFETKSMTVYLGNKPPIASFTVAGENVNKSIKFQSISADIDGNITNYHWEFGDGNVNTTTDKNVTHSYSSPACYKVNLTVTDNGGMTNTTSKSIAIGCGDVTCDGTRDISDVIKLLYYVGYPGQYTLCSDWAGDVTGDGTTDISDVIRLLYYVGYPGQYELNCTCN